MIRSGLVLGGSYETSSFSPAVRAIGSAAVPRAGQLSGWKDHALLSRAVRPKQQGTKSECSDPGSTLKVNDPVLCKISHELVDSSFFGLPRASADKASVANDQQVERTDEALPLERGRGRTYLVPLNGPTSRFGYCYEQTHVSSCLPHSRDLPREVKSFLL